MFACTCPLQLHSQISLITLLIQCYIAEETSLSSQTMPSCLHHYIMSLSCRWRLWILMCTCQVWILCCDILCVCHFVCVEFISTLFIFLNRKMDKSHAAQPRLIFSGVGPLSLPINMHESCWALVLNGLDPCVNVCESLCLCAWIYWDGMGFGPVGVIGELSHIQ